MGRDTSEPLVAGNFFTIVLKRDVVYKGRLRISSEEIAVIEMKNGKIVSETFFTDPGRLTKSSKSCKSRLDNCPVSATNNSSSLIFSELLFIKLKNELNPIGNKVQILNCFHQPCFCKYLISCGFTS